MRTAVYLRADGYRAAPEATLAATAFTSRVEPALTGHEGELPAGEYAFARVADTEVALALPQVDTAAERERLEKELAEAEAHADRLEVQLANPTFQARHPSG